MTSCVLIRVDTPLCRVRRFLRASRREGVHIVIDFRTERLFFCLVARIRDSNKMDVLTKDGSASKCSVIQGFVGRRKIFRNGKNAGLPVELDLVRGVGCDLDLARFGSNSGDHVLNRPPLAKLRDHQGSILRVFPNPEFADGTADHFGAGIAVSALECGVHIDESSFVECRNGDCNWARTEYILKFILRYSASFLRLLQCLLCLPKIRQTTLKFGPENLGTLVEARILNGRRGGDCQ